MPVFGQARSAGLATARLDAAGGALASRSNSESFAARYASHVPWNSRCSWVTLVRIATS